MNGRNTKGRKGRCRVMLLCVITTLFCSSLTLRAADYVEVTIPFTQKVEAQKSQMTEAFTYRLTALAEGRPMPEGSEGTTCEYEAKGNQTIQIGPITYHEPGVYEYELAQIVNDSKTDFTCDAEVYSISVSIVRKEDGELDAVIAARNHNKEKVGSLEFTNASNLTASSDIKKGVSYNGSVKKSGPRTGDTTDTRLWVLLSLGALLVIILTFAGKQIYSHKKRNEINY